MIRSYLVPGRVAASVLLGLMVVLTACTDDPTAPEITFDGLAAEDIAPPPIARPTLDPMVGLLIGSLEDEETARSVQDWVDALLLGLPPGAELPERSPFLITWGAEPTNPHDLITLDVLRLLMGDVPEHPEDRSQEGIER
jgi:hypothetical protein